MHSLRKRAVTTALVGLLVLGGAACSDDNGDEETEETSTE